MYLIHTSGSGAERRLDLSERTRVLVGRAVDPDEGMRVDDPTLGERHFVLKNRGDGVWVLGVLDSTSGCVFGDKRLEVGDNAELSDGDRFSAGDARFRLEDVAAEPEPGVAHEDSPRLRVWYANAEPFDDAALDKAWRSLDRCGSKDVQRLPDHHATLRSWIESFHDIAANLQFPYALALVADLEALVRVEHPAFRTVQDPVLADYVESFLRPLAQLPGVVDVRQSIQSCPETELADRVAAQFVIRVTGWLQTLWLESDARSILEPLEKDASYPMTPEAALQQAALKHVPEGDLEAFRRLDFTVASVTELREALQLCELGRLTDPTPKLLTNREDVKKVQQRIVAVVREGGGVARGLSRLDKFLLCAGTRIDNPYETYEVGLVDSALAGQDLDDHEFEAEPVREDETYPNTLNPQPGDRQDVVRVRPTSDWERLHEAFSQELALLRIDRRPSAVRDGRALPRGKRMFAAKVVEEGFLIPERRTQVREITRQRFLVCFVADVGSAHAKVNLDDRRARAQPAAAAPQAGPGKTVLNPAARARHLIFECLRDIGRFVDPREVDMDVRVWLDPVGAITPTGRPAVERAWATDLDELAHLVEGERYQFMLELERRLEGFFFKREAASQSGYQDHHGDIEDALAVGGYELTLFVFLGPRQTARSYLLPDDPLGGRTVPGFRNHVKLVHLDRPNWVEVTSGSSFDRVSVSADFDVVGDNQLRMSVLEALLGQTEGSGATPHEQRLGSS